MLAQGTLNSSINTIYTNNSNSSKFLKSFIFHNSNASNNSSIYLYVVKNTSGSVGNGNSGNRILYISLSPGETYEFSSAFPVELLQENDTIQAKSDTDGDVNYFIFGKTT